MLSIHTVLMIIFQHTYIYIFLCLFPWETQKIKRMITPASLILPIVHFIWSNLFLVYVVSFFHTTLYYLVQKTIHLRMFFIKLRIFSYKTAQVTLREKISGGKGMVSRCNACIHENCVRWGGRGETLTRKTDGEWRICNYTRGSMLSLSLKRKNVCTEECSSFYLCIYPTFQMSLW